MRSCEIAKGVFWTGATDPAARGLGALPHMKRGASYNSYLVLGSEKTAVVETVGERFSDEHIEKLSGLCDISSIDYIICNHSEPDHSGGLFKLLKAAKNASVVCTKPASVFLGNILNEKFECKTVEDGDTIELGGKTLRFISAPFLIWPDTMFTYIIEDAVLLTGNAFGFHFSAESDFDDMTPLTGRMIEAQKAYFDAMMSPFKTYVLDAVKKTRALHIDVIGPSHGPVLRKDPWAAVDRYEKWASDTLAVNNPKKVYIGFASCYGYTSKLAERIAQTVREGGCDAEVEDISAADAARCAAKIHSADAFAIGSPTINRDALKPVWDVLSSLSVMIVKGKAAAAFGSFGWSGESVKYLSDRLRNLGAEVVGTCSAKLNPDDKELAEAGKLGEAICAALAER